MLPNYKLIYFDVKGFGEGIKYILAYMRIEYELKTIVHFTGDGPWKEMKSSFPFGQLPVLEIEGRGRLFQSQAICQYLGKEHDLNAGNTFQEAVLTSISNSMQDFILKILQYFYHENPTEREKLRLKTENEVLPFYMGRFQRMLQNGGEFFAGKLTWVDFYVVGALEAMSGTMGKSIVEKYPDLLRLMATIQNLPGVREYIVERPPYER